MRASLRTFAGASALLALACGAPPATAPLRPPPASVTAENVLAKDLLKELVEINTTDASGNTTKAAEAMALRLHVAGFDDGDVTLLVGPDPRKGNLVARLRGGGATGAPSTAKRKPVLLLAHLDVVEAKRQDWSMDPFVLVEKDGYFYGRGTTDDKDMAAVFVANLIRMKREGFRPDRDIIVALTAGEEGGDFNGVDWLIEHHEDLIDAALCLNEGGGGEIRNGKYLVNEVQTSEKTYLTFRFEVKNKGGHSSLPDKDNAIYRLAAGLSRLGKYDFSARLNETTRAFFDAMSVTETVDTARDMKAVAACHPSCAGDAPGPGDAAAILRLSAQPYFNAMMRTTCVATELEAGHADNALPQTARALVNCRILPGDSAADVEKTLHDVVADDQIAIAPLGAAKMSPASPLLPELMSAVEGITRAIWPGVPMVPVMATGATDGARLRRAGIPTYGVSGEFGDIDDVRAHGHDERVGVRQFYDSQEFLYRLVRALSGGT